MYVTIVEVHVKDNHVQDFIEACRQNHEASIKENGNRRFDILQQYGDPTHFTLYEAYASERDAAAHKDTGHYLEWRNSVADWMACPRSGTVFRSLYPE